RHNGSALKRNHHTLIDVWIRSETAKSGRKKGFQGSRKVQERQSIVGNEHNAADGSVWHNDPHWQFSWEYWHCDTIAHKPSNSSIREKQFDRYHRSMPCRRSDTRS